MARSSRSSRDSRSRCLSSVAASRRPWRRMPSGGSSARSARSTFATNRPIDEEIDSTPGNNSGSSPLAVRGLCRRAGSRTGDRRPVRAPGDRPPCRPDAGRMAGTAALRTSQGRDCRNPAGGDRRNPHAGQGERDLLRCGALGNQRSASRLSRSGHRQPCSGSRFSFAARAARTRKRRSVL